MDSVTQRLMMGAAGAGGEKIYVEDVFSTWLYTGNGGTQTITNGIDLSGKGGLVWCKARSNFYDNVLGGPGTGTGQHLCTNDTNGLRAFNSFSSFSTNGFTLGSLLASNANAETYASWTFRKARGFFDVVTYTGTGVARTVPHNLGSVPGCIIVKRTDSPADWFVYHRSTTATQRGRLNTVDAFSANTVFWNDTEPTSNVFTVGTATNVNASGATYVAYLFAHDAGGFGDSGNESVVKCGSFTSGSSGVTDVTLGWEPQWLLIRETAADAWRIFDNMRGFLADVNSNSAELVPNTSAAEASQQCSPSSTGFRINTAIWGTSRTYIYIAIRRGPMKTPTSGTEVFSAVTQSTVGTFTSGFPVDWCLSQRRDGVTSLTAGGTRLTGNDVWLRLRDSPTNAEATSTGIWNFSLNSHFSQNAIGGQSVSHAFRRAPGFFDVVAYTGTGSARTVSHNLGVVPELMIIKQRSGTEAWPVYSASLAIDRFLRLNTNATPTVAPRWNNTAPTSAVFSLGTDLEVNGSGSTYIAYLFATCPGVSKVGSYTGTGTTLQVNCGFTAGARFVLIKRTDSTGDWYVWDTARGIIAANDPYLLFNSTAAEVTNTDYIDPLNSGFEISSTAPAAINANGGTYIYLAIA